MPVTLHPIRGRRRRRPIDVVRPDDFRLGAGEPADPAIVVRDPRWSLYAIDLAARAALFVRVAEPVAAAPFVYREQFLRADRVLRCDLDVLARIGRPRPTHFVHHCARCGSTLLTRMIGHADGVLALSEPDVFTQIAAAGLDRAAAVPLLRDCAYAIAPGLPGECVVVKPRHFVLEIANLLFDALPDSRAVTIRRDAEAVIASMFRVSLGASAVGLPGTLSAIATAIGPRLPRGHIAASAWWVSRGRADRAELLALCPELARDLRAVLRDGAVGFALALWTSALAAHVRCVVERRPILAVSYDDLCAAPARTLSSVMDHLGLSATVTPAMLAELDADAQAGTELARDVGPNVVLTRRERERIGRAVAARGLLPTPSAPWPAELAP